MRRSSESQSLLTSPPPGQGAAGPTAARLARRSGAWRVVLRHLYISPGHNFFGHFGRSPGQHPVLERQTLECLAGRGIVGDRFLDYKTAYKGQITFFEQETYETLCAHLGCWDRPPSVFRRNVVTRGLDLNTLIGVGFELQGVRFLGVEECRPCAWMNHAFAPGAEEPLRGHGGLRALIVTNGVLKAGVA